MKICMLSELFYPYLLGGAERRYYEIAKRLSKKHDITVYALRLAGQKDTENKDGIQIIRTGLKHPMNKRSILPLLSFPTALLRSITKDFDIIDANQGVASFVGALKPLSSTPVVATFHDIYWNQWGKYFNFPFSSVGKLMEFGFSKIKFDRIVTNSPETKKKLERLAFASPIEVIVSGIDTDSIKKVKSTKSEYTIVYVGRLVKYKNVDMLLRAAARLKPDFPKTKIRIIGSGPEEANLKSLSKSLDIGAEFLGYVSEEEKISIVKSSTIYVNPSSVEGLGLGLIEAMACKTAIVARNLDCYFFCNSGNSMLYTNENGLYLALQKLLENPDHRNKLARNAHRTAAAYSWDTTAKKVEQVYKEVSRRGGE